MRTNILRLSALLILASGCTVYEGPTPEDDFIGKPLTVIASLGGEPETKTILNPDKSIYWTPGDAINLFYGSAAAGQFTSDITEPAQTVEFHGVLSVATGSTNEGMAAQAFWAVYPYQESNTCDGSSVTITIPSLQASAAGSFADKLNPTVARAPGLSLSFYNVASWLCFTVTQSGITSATLRGNGDEDIAGKIRVTMEGGEPVASVVEGQGQKSITITAPDGGFEVGELYYIVLVPGTFPSGITLTLYQGTASADCVINKELTFPRNTPLRKQNADAGLVFDGNIHFADQNVKAICVANWDTDGDGELSYAEAAAVTSIPAGRDSGPNVFTYNTQITSFDEFQYFINCTTINNNSQGSGDDKEYFGAFEYCSSLTSITLPSSLTTIGFNAFSGCTALENLVIPASVTTIKGYAFMESYKLKLHFASTNPTAITFVPDPHDTGTYAFGPESDLGALLSNKVRAIYVRTPEAVTACQMAPEWNIYADRIFLEGTPYPAITVTLNKSSETISAGSTIRLTATIQPEYATDRRVTWSSGNTAVATVDQTGVVTAVATGTATITVTAQDGGAIATCEVTVPQTYATPELVDLGLPSGLKWASFNLGASAPEEYGDYYAWGETETKADYSWSTYKFGTSWDGPFSKYNTESSYGSVDNKTVLDTEDDVAHVKLGGSWRMPTDAEWTELRDQCTWTWTTQNGVNGRLVTSNTNGNSIFLPAAGLRDYTTLDYAGSRGYYWSSSLRTDRPYFTWYVLFYSDVDSRTSTHRAEGQSVRPVFPPVVESITLIKSSVSIIVGETAQLLATVLPSEAAGLNVSWVSSNTLVATVSENGVVTAVSEGIATIIASVGSKQTACSVTVTAQPSVPVLDAVDLGLSVKWATFNVGASAPEEYGDYYAWGETETKADYSWSTYKFSTSFTGPFSKYNTQSPYGSVDNKTILDAEDDVAHVKLGGSWRMPTDAEWTELREQCTWAWTTWNGVNGRLVTSNTNGNSIFLPAAGLWQGAELYNVGSSGCYGSSSLDTDYPCIAWYEHFDFVNVNREKYYRCDGYSVRAVSE